MINIELTAQDLERYDRQIRLPNLGVEGQRKLKSATVIVAGLGGLGCISSIYLAVAGVGRLILIDKEKVELSNLNRQILHWDKDIGRYKVDSAMEKLNQINPTVELCGLIKEINEENVKELIRGSNVVMDGMDNFRTRFILNKACHELGIPFIHAAIYGLEGRLMTIIPGKTPCLQCLIPTPPREVKLLPVLGAIPAVTAGLQVVEAVKIITGMGETTGSNLVIIDGEFMKFDIIKVARNESCPICGIKK